MMSIMLMVAIFLTKINKTPQFILTSTLKTGKKFGGFAPHPCTQAKTCLTAIAFFCRYRTSEKKLNKIKRQKLKTCGG